MQIALLLVGIAVTVVVFSTLARRLGFPAPLLLMVVGIVISYIPFIPDVVLTPEVVLMGLLPPLLYAAAIRTSIIDFRVNRAPIGSLSIALVVVSALAVGLVAWLLLPIPFAAAFALGAVVAPPDAVAATAIARRIGLPRNVVTVLEGESLLNDATAITCLRVALLALAGSVSIGTVTLAFVIAAGGGALVGAIIGLVAAKVRQRLNDTITDTAISLIVPFAAYIGAEEIGFHDLHASGVIAVVTAGLILGHKAPIVQSAQARLNERTNWATISFLLENAVFLLIGLQAKLIVIEAAESTPGLGPTIVLTLAVLGTIIVVRLLWVLAQRWLLFRRSGVQRERPWGATLVIGWAGMRGVVTLAIAFTLPAEAPLRPTLIFCALGVTAGTLLLQGLSLPWVARRTGLRGPDAREDALQAASVLQSSTRAALDRLEEIQTDTDSEQTVSRLRDRIVSRPNGIWERLGANNDVETPAEEYRRLRLSTLQAERDQVLHIRGKGKVDHEVIETVLNSLDIEESMLTAIDSRTARVRENLELPAGISYGCAHLDEAPRTVAPNGPGICLDCEREGTRPVHLRLCLTCGEVGCCDSSVGKHATRHFHETGHPVMRSFEQGEDWRWCYVDERLG